MEGIGSEVSHKIRAAIKAKLIELGAYVDDELPDYIMVMVANKRTRAQMDEDLQLFLSSNTKIFTSWLHTVLQKLQEVTVASFEGKKDLEGKKSKRKKDLEDGMTRSRKSSEEKIGKVKKHSKKHKEGKKAKKNKHKSKEKKSKSLKKQDKDEGKNSGERDETKTSQPKSKKIQLNEAVGKAILGDLKKNKKFKGDKNETLSHSGSLSVNSLNLEEKKEKENNNVAENCKLGNVYNDDDVLNIKVDDEPGGVDMESNIKRKELIEDEFNIEPLKPSEKSSELKSTKEKEESTMDAFQVETTISAPTEELLKEHNKLQNEKLEGEKVKEKIKNHSDSEESMSPEELRKQLLLSRAKKKLEESKLAERMRSNSPDVMILEETRGKETFPASRLGPEVRGSRSPHPPARSRESSGSPNRRSRKRSHSRTSDRRSHSPGDSRRGDANYKSKTRTSNVENRRRLSLSRPGRSSSPDRNKKSDERDERKKNVIKISESLEMEKNLGVKKEVDRKSQETTSRRRGLSSRVVTITGPEAPEIPSIVKVRPREFIAKDKQANKALILKAVADAEKSIATIHARPQEPDPEPKKLEALFTKNLRGKRYEKLAVTLSNLTKSPDSRDRTERRVSVDSEKSERSRLKHDSSDVSDGIRVRMELPSKKLSKSEDHFISSKTNIMEKNEKYIRCWLEGVEKAVKDEEIVNPSEMEDFVHYTDEENEITEGGEVSQKDDERKRKRPNVGDAPGDPASKNKKLSDKEIANLRVIPNSGENAGDGPQIVVTLDGLNSKAIKDLLLRNKETAHRPLGRKIEEKAVERKSSFEKISDRFGRLNKLNEEGGGGTKASTTTTTTKTTPHQSSDKKQKVSTESKNRQLIAQLSEKFGKVDREFENKKRKRPPEDERRCESRRNEKDDERNGKYRRSDRRSIREGKGSPLCKYHPNCKNPDCRYFHPKKCDREGECRDTDCQLVHPSETAVRKSKWLSRS